MYLYVCNIHTASLLKLDTETNDASPMIYVLFKEINTSNFIYLLVFFILHISTQLKTKKKTKSNPSAK